MKTAMIALMAMLFVAGCDGEPEQPEPVEVCIRVPLAGPDTCETDADCDDNNLCSAEGCNVFGKCMRFDAFETEGASCGYDCWCDGQGNECRLVYPE